MTASKKHHYIPRFYLTGFTNEDNKFHIYDKQTDKVWLTTPENSFAENHRNTGSIINPNTKEVNRSDLPEEMLDRFDSRSAGTIYEIRNSRPEDDILTPERLYNLRFFLVSTFWRTPANDAIRNDIIRRSSFEDLGFGFFKEGVRSIDTEKMLMDIDLWIKLYPPLLSMVSFYKKYDTSSWSDFKLYYRSGNAHVVTDNPVILKEFVDFSSLNNELLFPVSSKIFLVSTKKFKPRHLPPTFNMKMDLLLFKQAKRYVACCSKEYLLLLSESVKKFNSDFENYEAELKENLFEYFY